MVRDKHPCKNTTLPFVENERKTATRFQREKSIMTDDSPSLSQCRSARNYILILMQSLMRYDIHRYSICMSHLDISFATFFANLH